MHTKDLFFFFPLYLYFNYYLFYFIFLRGEHTFSTILLCDTILTGGETRDGMVVDVSDPVPITSVTAPRPPSPRSRTSG